MANVSLQANLVCQKAIRDEIVRLTLIGASSTIQILHRDLDALHAELVHVTNKAKRAISIQEAR